MAALLGRLLPLLAFTATTLPWTFAASPCEDGACDQQDVPDDAPCDPDRDDDCVLSLRQLRTTAMKLEASGGAGGADTKTPTAPAAEEASAVEAMILRSADNSSVDVPAEAIAAIQRAEAEAKAEDALLSRKSLSFQNVSATATSLMQTLTGKANTMTLYHQTSLELGPKILQEGFRPGRIGWCGGAIYFADNAMSTFTKAVGKDSHLGFIIQAKVDLGRVLHMGKTCKPDMTAQWLKDQEKDSVRFNPGVGDGEEYVIFDPNRVVSMKRVWEGSQEKYGGQ